jgi:hypothetical protein
MVKDRIKELVGEAAGGQRMANGNKRHLRTWLTAVVHLWTPTQSETFDAVEAHDEDVSA